MITLSKLVTHFPLPTAATILLLAEAVSSITTYKLPDQFPVEVADVFSLSLAISTTALFYQHSAHSPRQKLLAAAVVLWATRLAAFLLARTHAGFRDPRLAAFRDSRAGARVWCFAQTIWIFLSLIPVWVGMCCHIDQPPLNLVDGLALVSYVSGFIVEAVADWQKARFLAENNVLPVEKRQPFCHSGLFRYSRFANYFGEWVIWASLTALAAHTAGTRLIMLLPLCPLFVLNMFYKLSIPLAYKAVRKRATPEQYAQWLAISEFIPMPPAKPAVVTGGATTAAPVDTPADGPQSAN